MKFFTDEAGWVFLEDEGSMHFVAEGAIDLLWMLILCSLMKAGSDVFHFKGLRDCKLVHYLAI